jgi:hypothetical protein
MKSADNMLITKKRQKGVSTLIAFFIMSAFLVIVFGMNAILVGELKIIGGIGDSVIALYAAETGIERVLWEKALPPSGPYNDILDLGGSIYQSSYSASVISTSTDPGGCPSDVNFCIQSVGTYKDTRRAIQV